MTETRTATPIADMTDVEVGRALVDAARKYDHDNRPKGQNWGSVPPAQVARLITGALGAMEFEDAPADAAALRELMAEIIATIEARGFIGSANDRWLERAGLDRSDVDRARRRLFDAETEGQS